MQRLPVCFVPVTVVLLTCGCGLFPALSARGDATGERRRAQLAKVQRVIVIPAFFGTETLSKLDDRKTHPEKGKSDAKLTEYAEQLRSLQTHACEWLLQRVKARTNFRIVPQDELEAALKDLKLMPQTLFQNRGRLKGKSFAAPDRAAVRTLAERLHADAVLLSTLDEPRHNNGAYLFDPLAGITYDSPKVRGKMAFWMLLPDGAEVLHETTEVMHPVSKIGARTFLLTDWTETEDEIIEDFLDELTRYTPLKTIDRKAGAENGR